MSFQDVETLIQGLKRLEACIGAIAMLWYSNTEERLNRYFMHDASHLRL